MPRSEKPKESLPVTPLRRKIKGNLVHFQVKNPPRTPADAAVQKETLEPFMRQLEESLPIGSTEVKITFGPASMPEGRRQLMEHIQELHGISKSEDD